MTVTLPRIAVLVPCYNEALTVAAVVSGFRAALPDATIFVYDNNSTDGTAEVARAAGAQVRFEAMPGNGNVVRRMFADIDADWYIMVDGDATYDASAAPRLVETAIEGGYDMVNVARAETGQKAYRAGHRLGNRLLTGLVGAIFGARTRDMLSGYKIFSRRFAKSFPAMSSGFEIETSKLATYRDGFIILRLIGILVQRERPLEFFTSMAGLLALASLILGLPVVWTFAETGLVPKLPTAVLAASLMLASLLAIAIGLILNAITHMRREAKRLAYLAIWRSAP